MQTKWGPNGPATARPHLGAAVRAPSGPPAAGPAGRGGQESDEPAQTADRRQRTVAACRTGFDPAIPVNVYDIGLIYDIDIDASSAVNLRMTLTSPACPVAGTLPGEVEARAKDVPGVSAAKVELVWEPTWTMEMMSEEAKLQLGMT